MTTCDRNDFRTLRDYLLGRGGSFFDALAAARNILNCGLDVVLSLRDGSGEGDRVPNPDGRAKLMAAVSESDSITEASDADLAARIDECEFQCFGREGEPSAMSADGESPGDVMAMKLPGWLLPLICEVLRRLIEQYEE